MTRPDILIIDDDPMVRETIRDILEEDGRSVAEAADGKSGVTAIREKNPRLVICDVRMPGLNGYEVLQEIRNDATPVSNTSFIFLSGLNDKQYIKAGYKIGADDYLTKPVDYDVLCLKVDAMLRKQAAAGEAAGSSAAEPELDVPPAFKKRLEQLMDMEGGNASGRLKMVTLEEFQDHFGDRWEKIREKAMAIADGIVRNAMGKGDMYVRYGDDAFLVLFGGADIETCQRRSEKLAVDIRQRLLGKDKDFKGIGITADTVDVSKIAAIERPVTPQTLSRAFDSKATAMAAEEKKQAGGDDTSWFKSQLSVQYRPLWNPARQMIVGFECYPFRRSSYGVFSGRSVLHGGDQDPMAIHVDTVMAEQAMKCLQGPQAKVAPVIILPLHFSTLKAEEQGGLGDIFKSVPQARLQARLAIEVMGVPENRGETTIRQVLEFVKRVSGRVSVHLEASDRHAGLFKANGAETLALNLDDDWQTQSEKQILMRLLDFCKRAQGQGFHTTIYGLNSMLTIRTAVQAGVNLIGGRTIGDVRDAPVQPYALTRKHILS